MRASFLYREKTGAMMGKVRCIAYGAAYAMAVSTAPEASAAKQICCKNFENVNSKCEKNIKKYNQASRANSSRHSANTISAVFQPNISRG